MPEEGVLVCADDSCMGSEAKTNIGDKLLSTGHKFRCPYCRGDKFRVEVGKPEDKVPDASKPHFIIQVDYKTISETFYDTVGREHAIVQACLYLQGGAKSAIVIDAFHPHGKIFIGARI